MTAVDSNILIYAHRQDSGWFEPARQRLHDLAESEAPWAIPWPCIHEFVGIVSNPKVFKQPSTLEEAFGQVETWFASPHLRMLSERVSYWAVLKRTALAGQIGGPRIHDARIHAICLENGVTTLWSADRDFNRFAGLKIVNPLLSN